MVTTKNLLTDQTADESFDVESELSRLKKLDIDSLDAKIEAVQSQLVGLRKLRDIAGELQGRPAPKRVWGSGKGKRKAAAEHSHAASNGHANNGHGANGIASGSLRPRIVEYLSRCAAARLNVMASDLGVSFYEVEKIVLGDDSFEKRGAGYWAIKK